MIQIINKYDDVTIYKIVCKDETITNCYIGSTTNFLRRISMHKSACNNHKNNKLYNFIRMNGGWDNFIMVKIINFACSNLKQVLVKEHEYYLLYNSNLNTNIPNNYLGNNDYFKIYCLKNLEKKKQYNKIYNERRKAIRNQI